MAELSLLKILDKNRAIQKIRYWKKKKKIIIFTNGCFDILHMGHVDFLERAHKLGDKLVVAINSDSSVKSLKGKNRPINPEYARARTVAAFCCVQMVVIFSENTPYELISFFKPDILVKGSDYAIENIVGEDIVKKSGGIVKTIKLLEGYSTTHIVNKIKYY